MKTLEFLDSINVRRASVDVVDEESIERRRAARKVLVGELQVGGVIEVHTSKNATIGQSRQVGRMCNTIG